MRTKNKCYNIRKNREDAIIIDSVQSWIIKK